MEIIKKIINFLKSGLEKIAKAHINIDYNTVHKYDDTEYFIKDTIFKNGKVQPAEVNRI